MTMRTHIPVTSKDGLSLPILGRHPQPRRPKCTLVQRLLGRLGQHVLDLLRLGRSQDRLTLLGREASTVCEDLGQHIHLSQVQVGRRPELAEEVLEHGVVCLARICALDVVEATIGLCIVRLGIWHQEKRTPLQTRPFPLLDRETHQYGMRHGHQVFRWTDLGPPKVDYCSRRLILAHIFTPLRQSPWWFVALNRAAKIGNQLLLGVVVVHCGCENERCLTHLFLH